MKNIKIAIAGVGNCASSLIQGINYYRRLESDTIPGIMFKDIGGYGPTDIEVVAAFDVDKRKVGKPISEAIFAGPNCARVFQEEIDDQTVVQMGPVLDGVSEHMLTLHDEINFQPSDEAPVDVPQALRDSGADMLINYMPVGSEDASKFYAQAAIDAGIPFMNCIPVFIASDKEWEQKFIDAGLPIIGDDMRSQVGASILSQVFQELLFDRGHSVQFHSQINVGGNTDFGNMLNQERLASKKTSKENVIRAQNEIRDIPVPKDGIFAGPSSFIPHHKDNKVATFRVEATGFGGAPVTIDARLSVQDSENSAGVVIDAIRFLKVAHEMKIVGALRGPSAWTQKTPPEQMMYQDAKIECELLAKRELTDVTRAQVKDDVVVEKASNRQVFKIDVGDMPTEDAVELVNALQTYNKS